MDRAVASFFNRKDKGGEGWNRTLTFDALISSMRE
jgi:hypothetical protein